MATINNPAMLAAIRELQYWTDAKLNAFQSATKVEQPLYHYTSFDAFQNILRSNEMWLSTHDGTNDLTEVNHGLDIAADEADRIARTNGDVHGYLKGLSRFLRARLPLEPFKIYLGCFSKRGDDLSQWRAYGKDAGGTDAAGVCFALTPEFFGIRGNKDTNPPNDRCWVAQVNYDPKVNEEQARSAITEAMKHVRRCVGNKPPSLRGVSTFLNRMGANATLPLMWDAFTSKHPSFFAEEEVRLIVGMDVEILKPYINAHGKLPTPIDFREGWLHSVVAGPKSPTDAVERLEKLLNDLGLHRPNMVSRSRIPLR